MGKVNNKNMDNAMTDMGRMRPEPSELCATPKEPRGPEYPRLHDIDADKLPELKTTPIGGIVTITIKAKLVGLEMHEQKNGMDSYWPANCANLEILAAKVDAAPKAMKSNNKEADLGDLPMKSGQGYPSVMGGSDDGEED